MPNIAKLWYENNKLQVQDAIRQDVGFNLRIDPDRVNITTVVEAPVDLREPIALPPSRFKAITSSQSDLVEQALSPNVMELNRFAAAKEQPGNF